MKKAIYPGSFDPITNGHIDVIERASRLFDHVTVVVMYNYHKKGKNTFTPEERTELIKKSTAHLENVEVDHYSGLLADYTKEHGITVIVKGLRAVSDFENEFQQAIANKHIDPDLDTVLLPCSERNMFLSSSLVKQIGELGGDISSFVPAEIAETISERLSENRKDS